MAAEMLSSVSMTVSVLATQISYNDIVILTLAALGLSSYYSSGILWNRPDPLSYKFYERPQLTNQPASQQTVADPDARNIAHQLQKLEYDGVIFWASQSGRAEGYANRLQRDMSQRYDLRIMVADISDYDPETISDITSTHFALFIMSTYGEGEPPDNGWSFWNWIHALEKQPIFKNLNFAAFGLGNSNYRYYNKVIDVVSDVLISEGGTALVPTGKADDATDGAEEDFIQWKEGLYVALRGHYSLAEKRVQYQPRLQISFRPDPDERLQQLHDQAKFHQAHMQQGIVSKASLKSVKLISSQDAIRNCLHLELNLSSESQAKYKTGDHLLLWPTNPEAEVERLLNALNVINSSKIPISVTTPDVKNHAEWFPSQTTLCDLFKHHLEICAPVSREVVRNLYQFTSSATVRETLLRLSASKQVYADFTATRHINMGRLLEFASQSVSVSSWSNLLLPFVLENLGALSPRCYSISSSSSISPHQASITVTVAATDLGTNPSVKIPGVASSYLLSHLDKVEQQPRSISVIPVQLRRSNFKLPASASTPLILIAAGSGIAPMRAFLQERARLASLGRESGLILFFYGCRHPEQDYLYCNEIEALEKGALQGKLETVPAFSRHDGHRVYVQDRITEYGETIAKLLTAGSASLYICGSTVMAKATGAKVMEAVEHYAAIGDRSHEEWRAELKRFRRWQEDVWG